MLIVTSRMMYGMARDKALPIGISKISSKHRTPIIAVYLTTGFTLIPIFIGNISLVANATVFGVLITFFLVNISLIALRKTKPDLERPFELKPSFKGVPLIALLGSIVCIALLFTFTDDFIWILRVKGGRFSILNFYIFPNNKEYDLKTLFENAGIPLKNMP